MECEECKRSGKEGRVRNKFKVRCFGKAVGREVKLRVEGLRRKDRRQC